MPVPRNPKPTPQVEIQTLVRCMKSWLPATASHSRIFVDNMTRDTIVLKATDSCIKPSLRTRTGCLTCRRRKKRCDERRPSCTGCQRNRLECQWESAGSLIWPKRRRARGTGAEKLLPDQAQRMVNVFSVLTPDIVSRLLRHFLNASPRWLSTRTGPRRTDYMKWLSPALSKSHVVRSCVLAIAAADLLKYYGNHPQLQHAAFEYYGQAVSSLRRAIESELSFDSSSDAFSSGTNPPYTSISAFPLI